MRITKEITTTKREKITVYIEESKVTLILDEEKETEAISQLLDAAEKVLDLNSMED